MKRDPIEDQQDVKNFFSKIRNQISNRGSTFERRETNEKRKFTGKKINYCDPRNTPFGFYRPAVIYGINLSAVGRPWPFN